MSEHSKFHWPEFPFIPNFPNLANCQTVLGHRLSAMNSSVPWNASETDAEFRRVFAVPSIKFGNSLTKWTPAWESKRSWLYRNYRYVPPSSVVVPASSFIRVTTSLEIAFRHKETTLKHIVRTESTVWLLIAGCSFEIVQAALFWRVDFLLKLVCERPSLKVTPYGRCG